MKKTCLLLVIMALVSAAPAFAQLSKGEPSTQVFKTGNRPGAGDFGLFFGGGVMTQQGEKFLMPIFNFKYFASDNLELRASLEVFRKGEKQEGTVVRNGSIMTQYETYHVTTGRMETTFLHLVPGLAHHFSKHNILDVYLGVEFPFGWENAVNQYSTISGDAAPDAGWSRTISSPFVVGVNALVGLQAFVGRLPLAIGFEYGLGSKAQFQGQTKYITTNADGKAISYYKAQDDSDVTYTKLSNLNYYVDYLLRFTLSYYFN